jgi:hypothetical protein
MIYLPYIFRNDNIEMNGVVSKVYTVSDENGLIEMLAIRHTGEMLYTQFETQ